MAAVQRFTDPAAVAASEGAKGLQPLLLGAGLAPALSTAAEQSPRWLGGSAGQGRLKTALAALQDITDVPGMLTLMFALVLRWYCTITAVLHWYFTGIALVLHWYCTACFDGWWSLSNPSFLHTGND